jgi:hypothetical protein
MPKKIMTFVRTFVHFDGTFEDDAVYDDDGGVLTPPGKAILSVIQDRLTCSGYQLTPIEQHSFYGWTFDINDTGLPVWVLLQPDWLLMIGKRGFLGRRVRWPSETKNIYLPKLLKVIHGILASDTRVDDIRWYTPSGYDQSSNPHGHDFPTE